MQIIIKSNRGSVLVGVVALCAIMGIGVAGLLGVTRNTVSQEVDAYNDVNAFLAAESGLFQLTAAVKGCTKKITADIDVNIPDYVDEHGISIPVEAKIDYIGERPGAANEPDTVRCVLFATAIHPKLPYVKKLEWAIETTMSSVEFPSGGNGMFVNNLPNDGNGLRTQHFDGDFHSNKPLFFKKLDVGSQINTNTYKVKTPLDNQAVIFTGNVTVNPVGVAINYGKATNGTENDYGRGLSAKNVSAGDYHTYLDNNIFFGKTEVGKTKGDGLFRADNRYLGVTVIPDESKYTTIYLPGTGSNDVLTFTGANIAGNVGYYKFKGTTYDYPLNKPVMMVAKNSTTNSAFELTIKGDASSGGMFGNVTVMSPVTANRKNIKIDVTAGNIIYGNTTVEVNKPENNYGLNNSSGLLAVYSAQDIILLLDKNTNQNPIITAQLFAADGLMNGVSAVKGAIKMESIHGMTHNETVYVVGVAVMDWFYDEVCKSGSSWSYGNSCQESNPTLQVCYDRRSLSAPGIYYTEGNGVILKGNDMKTKLVKKESYKETNTSKSVS